MALWPTKKEVSKDDATKGEALVEVVDQLQPAGEEVDQLRVLTTRLSEIGKDLDRTTKQVIGYLIHKETKGGAGAAKDGPAGALGERLDLLSKKLDQLAAAGLPRETAAAPASAAPAAGEESLRAALRPLQDRLDQIEARLKSLAPPAGANASETLGPLLLQLQGTITEQKEALAAAFRQLWQRVDQGLAEIAQYVRPPETDDSAGTAAGSAEWQQALFGREIAEHPALAFQRQQLLNGLLENNAAACALVGQLLVFQSAPPEKMPPLLKEIGEAYYRWHPKTKPGANKMEEILVDWLKKTCDVAGISNTIELVHPGERFAVNFSGKQFRHFMTVTPEVADIDSCQETTEQGTGDKSHQEKEHQCVVLNHGGIFRAFRYLSGIS